MIHLNKKLSTLSKNKDVKTVASNFLWLSVLQVAGYVFPLITMPYLAHVIGVNGFGKVAFASAIMVWIQTIADWGFNLTATRDVAQNRDNPKRVSEIFSNVLWSRCLLMIISLVILLLLIVIVPKFREERIIILVTFLMVPGHILFPDWFFQAIEKMKYITLLNVLMKFIFTVAVFIFVKKTGDYILQPLFTSIGYVVCGAIALFLILGRWGIKLQKPSWPLIIKTIKGSTDVFINHLMPNLYNSFSTMLLGFVGGGGAVGILEGGNKFIHVGTQLQATINRAFYPFLSRKIERHSTYVKICLCISAFLCIMFFFGAPLIVRFLLAPEFVGAISIIRIRSISMIFSAILHAYGANYLIIRHEASLLRKITMGCSIVGFIISWPLVHYFSYIGAALTVTISLGLLAVFTLIAAIKIKNKSKR